MRTSRLPLVHAVLTLLLLTIAIGTTPVAAQFGALRDAARKAQEELKKKEAEDKAKKEAEAKKEQPAAAAPAPTPPAETAPPAPATQSATPAGETAPAFQAYSKFDFVPGEKVVGLDDFTQDAVGDFPAKWNTNGSGEIVTLAGKAGRWLKLTRGGFFIPEFITELPDNFTLEFDLTVPPTFNSGQALNVVLVELADPKLPQPWQTSTNVFTFTAHPGAAAGRSSMITRQDSTSVAANFADTVQLSAKRQNPVHVSVWRQRQRVRVYMNEEKVWDVPRAILATAKLNTVIFWLSGVDANMEYYLANVRVATGAPDTRNKILTEGKWVSHGILFDVNSDRIKGESYGSLKEIAGVLTENADLRVQIVGHTDADGDEAANLDLSRRRAASVKSALETQFAINAGRMETDGKGEGQPVDKNDNPAGKANNRRVEFIKR